MFFKLLRFYPSFTLQAAFRGQNYKSTSKKALGDCRVLIFRVKTSLGLSGQVKGYKSVSEQALPGRSGSGQRCTLTASKPSEWAAEPEQLECFTLQRSDCRSDLSADWEGKATEQKTSAVITRPLRLLYKSRCTTSPSIQAAFFSQTSHHPLVASREGDR